MTRTLANAAFLVALCAPANVYAQGVDMPCPFGSPARSALGWRFGEDTGVVLGQVVDVSSGRPSAYGLISLRLITDRVGMDSIVTRGRGRPSVYYTYRRLARLRGNTDSLGRFRIPGVPSGVYRLTILDYQLNAHVQDTVTVGGGGLRVFAALARSDGDIACVTFPDSQPPPNEELKPTAEPDSLL